MKTLMVAASAAAIVLPAPVVAQAMDHAMHGMKMPAKPAAKPKPRPKAAARKARPQAVTPTAPPVVYIPPMPAPAPAPEVATPQPVMPVDHAAMDHGAMDHGAMNHGTEPTGAMPGMQGGMMTGMGGTDYAEGSGTSRLPAREGMMRGVHVMTGDWMLMAHGYAWGSYTDQGGPRGANEAFVQSMAMVTAERPLGDGVHLKLQTMLSLEPLMGARGYPNLLATGEVANRQALIDRQHPHDLFMELSGRIDVDVAAGSSVFLYGGPVGEPALGPSAFMHRKSAQYQPLAPITHHWFDSTHITYGVITAGYSAPTFQIEASAFRGREPDERRWNIETPRFDSWSVRGTWTPSPAWAVQVSHGRLKEPEELEPGVDEQRTTASVHYATGALTTTLAFSAKNKNPGRVLTAWLGEVNYDLDAHHSVFGRFESVANDELFRDPASPLHDRQFRVGKIEGGYAYRLPLVGPLGLAIGGTVGTYAIPKALEGAYGTMPVSFTLFAKLALGN